MRERDRVGPDRLTVEKRKWDGRVSARWRAIGVSVPGALILHTPARTPRDHPAGGWSESLVHRELTVGCGEPWLVTAVIDAEGVTRRVYADAVLPPRRRRGTLSFVDLDLDLEIDVATGGAALRDEDDLARRTEEMGYPDWVVAEAWAGVRAVRERLDVRAWPFDASLWVPARDAGSARSHAGGVPG